MITFDIDEHDLTTHDTISANMLWAKAFGWEPRVIPAPIPTDWEAWRNGEQVTMYADTWSYIVRHGRSNGQILGRVSSRFKPLLNHDLCDMALIAHDYGWALDSVQEFRRGKIVAITLRGPQALVDGHAHRPLMTVLNYHTGNGALRFVPMDRRLSCLNQLPLFRDATTYSYRHTGHVAVDKALFTSMFKPLATLHAQQQRWADIDLDLGDALPALIRDIPTATAEKTAAAIRAAYIHPSAPRPGTAYAMLQAAILADQKLLPRKAGQYRSFMGSELSQRALDYAESLSV